MSTENKEASNQLAKILEEVRDLKRQKEQVAAELKTVSEQLDELEALACEYFAASGLDGCRAAGYSWYVEETLRLHVPKAHREAVLQAAAEEGIGDEVLTVQTQTLKSWLTERLKKAKAEGRMLEKATDGTAFAGLLSEHIEVRLGSRKVS